MRHVGFRDSVGIRDREAARALRRLELTCDRDMFADLAQCPACGYVTHKRVFKYQHYTWPSLLAHRLECHGVDVLELPSSFRLLLDASPAPGDPSSAP